MAQKRSSKKTSFGKKTAPEKAFIKRGRRSRNEDQEEKPKRSSGQTSRFSASKPDRFVSGRFTGKNSKSEGDSEDKPKRNFRRSSSPEGPSRFEGGKFERKDFRKKESTGGRFERPAGLSGTTGRPFRKRSDSDFDKSPERSPSKFSKRPSFNKRPSDKPFSKDIKRKSEGPTSAPRSVQSLGFTKKGKTTPKSQPEYPVQGTENTDGLTRLNKHIANSGMGSRREADEMIKKGLISVNGVTITEMGFKVKQGDVVRYEDKVLKAEKPVYVLLNKPKGFITTTADPQERKTVMNLVASACKERLYPVGRLDRNTTGLLLLTNDGDLAAKLTHPSFNTKKIYKVELDKPLAKADLQKIQDGVRLEEGNAIVDDVAYISDNKKEVGIELHIGWNRVVRRIFEALEYQVVKLDRVIFAGLDKKDLPRGEWRFLKPEEVIRLKHFK